MVQGRNCSYRQFPALHFLKSFIKIYEGLNVPFKIFWSLPLTSFTWIKDLSFTIKREHKTVHGALKVFLQLINQDHFEILPVIDGFS